MSIIDVQKEVTAKIVSALEQGGLDALVMPWSKSGESLMPYNFGTSAHYNGINIPILWVTGFRFGYSRNGWLTYRQAKEIGGQVREGESGTKCFYTKVVERVTNGEEDNYRLLRFFTVFNLDQIDGLYLPELEHTVTDEKPLSLVKDLERYAAVDGLALKKRLDYACFIPALDRVDMPAGEFFSDSDYAAIFAHECVHSTNIPKRLGRSEHIKKMFDDSKKAYALEELVAEIGANILCATYGFTGRNSQHESYVAEWLEALEYDHTFIFKASALASKAVEYILSKARLVEPVLLAS